MSAPSTPLPEGRLASSKFFVHRKIRNLPAPADHIPLKVRIAFEYFSRAIVTPRNSSSSQEVVFTYCDDIFEAYVDFIKPVLERVIQGYNVEVAGTLKTVLYSQQAQLGRRFFTAIDFFEERGGITYHATRNKITRNRFALGNVELLKTLPEHEFSKAVEKIESLLVTSFDEKKISKKSESSVAAPTIAQPLFHHDTPNTLPNVVQSEQHCFLLNITKERFIELIKDTVKNAMEEALHGGGTKRRISFTTRRRKNNILLSSSLSDYDDALLHESPLRDGDEDDDNDMTSLLFTYSEI